MTGKPIQSTEMVRKSLFRFDVYTLWLYIAVWLQLDRASHHSSYNSFGCSEPIHVPPMQDWLLCY